jgi:hypothetical protein
MFAPSGTDSSSTAEYPSWADCSFAPAAFGVQHEGDEHPHPDVAPVATPA